MKEKEVVIILIYLNLYDSSSIVTIKLYFPIDNF